MKQTETEYEITLKDIKKLLELTLINITINEVVHILIKGLSTISDIVKKSHHVIC